MRSWLRGPMTTATAGPNAVSTYFNQAHAKSLMILARYSDDGGNSALVHEPGCVRARASQDTTLFLRASCEKENRDTLSIIQTPELI